MVELALELLDCLRHLVLAFAEAVDRLCALGSGRWKLADFALNLPLLLLQQLGSLDRILRVASRPIRTCLFELATNVFQPSLGCCCLALPCASILRRRLSHSLRGLLQVSGVLCKLGIVVLACQALKLSCRFLHLLRQVPLSLAATTRRSLLGLHPPTLPLGLLLLPTPEFLQLLDQLIDFVVGLLLLPTLDGLVLVLEFVELEFEQVGKIFGRLLPATTATTTALLTLLLLHISLVRLLGLLEESQRGLLVGQRITQLLLREVFFGVGHRLDSLRQDGGHVPETGIGSRQSSVLHALQKRADLLF